MSIASTITTAEALLRAGDIGRCELVRGELKMMTPAGEEHGLIVAEVAYQLIEFVKRHDLGRVYGAETGFVIGRNPDTVRAPDMAFISKERVGRPQKGFREGAPDLAVEVLSPGDSASDVQEKTTAWLEGGAQQVSIVDSAKRTITIYRPDRAAEVFRENETLTTDDLLPGFELRVSQVFD